MAKGYWRVQRYQVFYGEQSSVYASTEKQAVKLAKKHNGMAVECDGGRVVYPSAQHGVEADALPCGHNTGIEFGESSWSCVVCGQPVRRSR